MTNSRNLIKYYENKRKLIGVTLPIQLPWVFKLVHLKPVGLILITNIQKFSLSRWGANSFHCRDSLCLGDRLLAISDLGRVLPLVATVDYKIYFGKTHHNLE